MPRISKTAMIREHILGKIRNGEWQTGFRIPSEAELMRQFSASRMTVHRAVKELAAEGFVVRERGRGSFVARRIPRSELLEIGDVAEEVRRRGGNYYCRVLLLELLTASPGAVMIFGPKSEGSIAHSLIVHYEADKPLMLEDRYADMRVAPGYLDHDFTSATAHKFLMRVAPLQKAEHELTAVLPTTEQQRHLGIGADEPCLLLKRRTWSGGKLASYAELLYPGSRYSFGGEFIPAK